jgi:hypothetical protein
MRRTPRRARAAALLAAAVTLALAAAPAASQGPTGPQQQRWIPWGVPVCMDFCFTYGPLHNCCNENKPPLQ